MGVSNVPSWCILEKKKKKIIVVKVVLVVQW